MSKNLLLNVTKVTQRLQHLYNKHRVTWLTGDGKWPLSISLGLPNQKTALNNKYAVGDWITGWRHWQEQTPTDNKLHWCTCNWSSLGRQQLPEKIIFPNAASVAQWLGQQHLWQQICKRYEQIIQRWPQLRLTATKYFQVLAEYSEKDFIFLQEVIDWLLQHPKSQIYLRQLPLPGIHTKWIEARKNIIATWLRNINGKEQYKNNHQTQNFYKLTGLKSEPHLIRMRILDANLRRQLGGLSDVCASITELAQLNFATAVERIYIVENLRTGLAFTELSGAIVFMALGYGVNQLRDIPWVSATRSCYYWGDLDTHGFAILNRARSCLPQLESLLMDKETLLKEKELWTQETEACHTEVLQYLNDREQETYRILRNNVLEHQIRLEQERIEWNYAWGVITQTVSSP